MVTCSCGKVMDKIPSWMDGIKVQFVCNNCPNRQTKNIAFINLDAGLHASAKIEDPAEVEAAAEIEAEAADIVD